ncbi:unnamed protein product [Ceratitis capitata]|uniref:(Mediterranean fruit fly) hypothetical protein n=1 Tax=Ceratitis capitata TaxID=7213 RepID=A0A811VGA4_CERCA|nr:unnamed protein product [Ceratitis capitata]
MRFSLFPFISFLATNRTNNCYYCYLLSCQQHVTLNKKHKQAKTTNNNNKQLLVASLLLLLLPLVGHGVNPTTQVAKAFHLNGHRHVHTNIHTNINIFNTRLHAQTAASFTDIILLHKHITIIQPNLPLNAVLCVTQQQRTKKKMKKMKKKI